MHHHHINIRNNDYIIRCYIDVDDHNHPSYVIDNAANRINIDPPCTDDKCPLRDLDKSDGASVHGTRGDGSEGPEDQGGSPRPRARGDSERVGPGHDQN